MTTFEANILCANLSCNSIITGEPMHFEKDASENVRAKAIKEGWDLTNGDFCPECVKHGLHKQK